MARLPFIVATTPEAAAIGLEMLAAGKAWCLVYVEDVPGHAGAMKVFSALAPGHEHRVPELEALIQRASDRAGCTVVDPGALVKRGVA